jgi:hypothetical protein
MKMSPAMKFSLPVILALAVAFLAGCAATPPVDWSTRIGNYTYFQAVAELGPPDRQARLSDGKLVCKWFNQTLTGTRFNGGMSHYGNNGFGAGQTIGSGGYNTQTLQLTFDTNNSLTAWSKNY